MARINIEETIWSDPRFARLIGKTNGSQALAIGALICAWKQAQFHWGGNEDLKIPQRSTIPLEVWNRFELAQELLEVGFAEVQNNKVYVKGSLAHLDWLAQRIAAGKKGGEMKKKNKSKQ